MSQTKHNGRFWGRIFVNPSVQLGVTGWFLSVALLTLLFQFLQFTNSLVGSARQPDLDSAGIHRALVDEALSTLLSSVALALPLTLAVGLLATFRSAGPIHHMTAYLRRVRDGEEVGECSLRKGDHYEELCVLINTVTREQRRQAAQGAPVEHEQRDVA